MAKMTPEQEAVYALGFGVSRDGLPRPHRKHMTGCWNSAGAASRTLPCRPRTPRRRPAVIHDARGALAEGRRVFLCRIPAMYDQPIAVGTAGLRGPSSVIESLENLGWRLDQMSWVPRAGHRAEGYFLFRRYDGPSGG
jgi:hypothetical protein